MSVAATDALGLSDWSDTRNPRRRELRRSADGQENSAIVSSMNRYAVVRPFARQISRGRARVRGRPARVAGARRGWRPRRRRRPGRPGGGRGAREVAGEAGGLSLLGLLQDRFDVELDTDVLAQHECSSTVRDPPWPQPVPDSSCRHVADDDLTHHGASSSSSAGDISGAAGVACVPGACPRQDSNLRTRLRRAVLYPLSYEGGRAEHSHRGRFGRPVP